MAVRNRATTPAEAAFGSVVSARGGLFAVVDTARESSGPDRAVASGSRSRSLYEGAIGEQLSHGAPYLVEFRARSPFRVWWFEQWGRHVGVLVEARARFDQLRRHLRTLMVVNTEDGKKYYFRFYDPRVLRVFLPSCTGDDVKRFFGPITAFYCEGEDGKELLTFRPEGDRVSVTQSPVSPEDRIGVERAEKGTRTWGGLGRPSRS